MFLGTITQLPRCANYWNNPWDSYSPDKLAQSQQVPQRKFVSYHMVGTIPNRQNVGTLF